MFIVKSEVDFIRFFLIILKKLIIFLFSPLKIKCTWPIFSTPNTSVLKPPLVLQYFAALLEAATTELSSIAIGRV